MTYSFLKDSLDSFHVPPKNLQVTSPKLEPTFSKANFYQLQHFTQSLNLLAIGTAWFRTDATAQYIMGDSDRNVVYFGLEFFF